MTTNVGPTVPPGWALTTLGEIGRYHNGRAFKDSDWGTTGRPIIRIQDLTKSRVSPHYFDGTVETRHEVRPGDLLISWAATLGAFIWHGPDAVLNQHIFRVDSYIDRRFHYYAAEYVLDGLRRRAHGSGMVHVTKGTFDETPIVLPPMPEQARIVDALDDHFSELDAAEASLASARARLERFRASVLQAAVTGRLVPTEAELARRERRSFEPASVLLKRILAERRRRWAASGRRGKYVEPAAPDSSSLPPLPEGWCWASPKQVFRWSSGSFLPKANQRDGDVPVFGGNGVSGRHSDPLVELPTLVIGRVGANCGNVYVTDGPAWITDNAIFATADSAPSNLDYWRLVLTARNLNANAAGTGQPYVNQKHLDALVVPLCPEAEQLRVVERFAELDSVASRSRSDVGALATRCASLRRSILRLAFSGGLVDPDPNDEPASVLLERIRAARASAAAKTGRASRTRRRIP